MARLYEQTSFNVASLVCGWNQAILFCIPSDPFELNADAAIALLVEAVEHAKKVKLSWLNEPLKLKPARKLVQLVRKSQELAILSSDGGDGGTE